MADTGARAASLLWARLDLRRRWKSMVVLGVLAGITAGFAMAALAGARRADTALARFRTATASADAVVFASQVGVPHPEWDKLRARPEVADLAVWDLMFGNENGQPGGLLFVANDDAFGGRIGKPLLLSGRMWDPNAPDEIVVTPPVAKDLPIGSTTTFQPFGAAQGDSDPAPTGPTVTFKVVGVVQTINYFLFTDGQEFVGPGFVKQYGSQVQLAENVDVRLRNGAADIPALQRDVNEDVAPGTPVLDLHAASRRVDTTISVEYAALLMLGVAIAVAGGLLVAQALGRSASVIGDDALVLRAIGMTRSDVAGAATVSHALTFVVALVVALGSAITASQLFPVGLSRKVDPDVGVHADWTVLGGGLLALAALLLSGTLLVARRAARDDGQRPPRASRLIAAVRGRAPLTIGIGTTLALDGGSGRTRVSVRPALVGAVVGVLGVVGALTIQHGVDDSLAHPERAGVTWDATVTPQDTAYVPHGLDPAFVISVVAAAPSGSSVATLSRFVVQVNGVGVASFAIDDEPHQAASPISFAVTSGRAPVSDDEVAIGPKTAKDIHARIGDTIDVGDDKVPLRVVGEALFPPDVHAEFDEGIWLSKSQFEVFPPVVSQEDLFQGAERAVAVRFPKGTDKGSAIDALTKQIGDQSGGVSAAEVPVELANLRNVRTLPLLLAAFLGLLAVAAVSHVLVTSTRRRRRDFAVLRAIGFNRRSTRLVLNAQGSTIAVVGILLGIPLGVASGRTAWHWVATKVPLEDVPPFALLAVLLVVPVTVLVVNALALWPGRQAARLHPAEVLRAE